MIVAIVNQTSPVGTVRVEEFREAASEAVAVTDFVNEYNPPKNPADYLGFDTGWSVVQKPAPGYFWAYDFGSPGLVQVAIADPFNFKGYLMGQNNAKAVTGATPFAWEDLVQWSGDLSFLLQNVEKAQIRVWGRYKASAGGGGGPELRIQSGGVDLGAPQLMADAGAFTNFGFWTTATLDAGRKLYRLQAKLNDAGATLEVEATSLLLLEKKF